MPACPMGQFCFNMMCLGGQCMMDSDCPMGAMCLMLIPMMPGICI